MGALLMDTPARPQIVAQTGKFDALKVHKTGMLQQLFPLLDEAQA